MRSRRFVQVDVFTAEAYLGNPLAVVCDGEGLSTPEADYRVRIFTPTVEPGFAAPPLRRDGPVDDAAVAQIARVLNIEISDIVDSQWADNGPGWVAGMLRDARAVLALKPAFVEGLDIGVVGMYPPDSPSADEVPAFFAKDGSTVDL